MRAILTADKIRRPGGRDAVRSVIRCPCFTDQWTRTSVSALGGTRRAGQNGDVGPRSWRSSCSAVIVVVMGARFVGDNQAPQPCAATGRRAPHPSTVARRHAHGRSPSRSAAFTSPARSRRCPASSGSTSATSATASTRSSSTSRTKAARSDSRPPNVPLARTVGATRPFYNPKALVALAHRNGIYMIGRVVCFQDPKLARGRPDLAIQRPDGSVWTTTAGLGWVNPYDRRVWDYCASVARGGRRRRIRPDHVRLRPLPLRRRHRRAPSIRAGRASPRGRVIADFVAYAKKRLEPQRHEGLDRRLRPLGVARPRDRPGSPLDLEVRRQHVADVVSRALRRRRARAREPEHPARRDGVPHADGLPPPGEGLARPARAVGAGLELHARAGAGPGRRRTAPGRQGLPALERVGDLHEGRARARERRSLEG